MKHIYATFFILLLYSPILNYGQSKESINYEFNNIIRLIPSNIFSSDGCIKMINKLNDITDDIDYLLESYENDNYLILKKQQSKALESFIRSIGVNDTAPNQINMEDFDIVRDLLNMEFTDLYGNKFCAKIYELRIGNYKCLLALKRGSKKDIWRIKASLKSPAGNATSTIESGIESNHYLRIWSGGETLKPTPFKVLKLDCIFSGNFNY